MSLLKPAVQQRPGSLHIVEVSTSLTRNEAINLTGALRQAGFDPYIVRTEKGFATRLGAFRERGRAHSIRRAAALRGFRVRVFETN